MNNREEIKYKHTEVGVIPSDWEVAELSRLVEKDRPISYGIVQTGKGVLNGVKCLRVVDLVNGKINTDNLITTSKEISYSYKRTILKKGDLVIALRGKIGELAIIDDELVDSNLTRGIALIALKKDYLNSYLLHHLQSAQAKKILENRLNGSALKELAIGVLRKVPVCLPPTTKEQSAIAAVLTDTDNLISRFEKLIAKKEAMKKGTIQQLLTGKKRLPGFDGKWQKKKLNKIFKFLSTANNSRAELSDDGEVGYIHYGDIHTKWNEFLDVSIESIPYIKKEKVKDVAFLEDGDLLIADASEDYDGLCACIEIKNARHRKIVGGLHTLLLRGNKEEVSDGFKGYMSHLKGFKEAVIKAATGISVYGISKKNLGEIEITIPDVKEQAAIASIIADMTNEINQLKDKHQKYVSIKQAMMQTLLTGKIRLT